MKVQITIHGRQALVDHDQVKLLKNKEALVKDSIANPQNAIKNSSKIISLNRRIRKNVKFL